MGNAAIGLRESFALTSERLGKCLRKIKELKEENEAQAERLARLQGEAAAREEGSSNRLKELEGQVEAAAKRAADAEGKAATAESAAAAEVRAARERAAAAVEKAVAAAREMTAAQEKAAAAEKAAAESAAEKAGAVACADEATARAGEAEERAREAEGKVRAAEDEARRAVADYKASDEFKQEVIEGSLDAYVQGFEMCKVKVSAALKIDIVALDGVQPGGSDEESAEDQQEAEPAPGES